MEWWREDSLDGRDSFFMPTESCLVKQPGSELEQGSRRLFEPVRQEVGRFESEPLIASGGGLEARD